MKNNNSEQGSIVTNHPVAIGVGIATLAAAAAGAYYLYGTKNGPQKRKQLKAWMLRMKADVMEEIENLKEINEEAYRTTISKIAEKYRQIKDIDPSEISGLATKMQSHWKAIQRDVNQATKPKKSRTSKKKSGSKK